MNADEKKLIPRDIMSVFNTIYTNGETQAGGKLYRGLQAESSDDVGKRINAILILP
jgi:hypothetical protein